MARYGPNLLVILLAVGPASYALHGSMGLAWGIGFGLAAGGLATRAWGPGWGLVAALSAGLAGGVGTAGLLGGIKGIVAGGVVWGFIGCLVGQLFWPTPVLLKQTLSAVFYGSLIVAVVGGIVAGLIGLVLDDFSLTGAGYAIGLFVGMFWGLGGIGGMVLGNLMRR